MRSNNNLEKSNSGYLNWFALGQGIMEDTLLKETLPANRDVQLDSLIDNRRNFQRVCINIHGRYMRENKEEFPCMTRNISVGGVALSTNGNGFEGEAVIVYLDDLGRLPGFVVRTFDQGLAVRFDINTIRRNKLVDRLTWLVNRDLLAGPDNRSYERFAPGNKDIIIQFEDGHQDSMELMDISLSGASLKTQRPIPVGTNIIVGKLRAKVMRHHDNGIGVQFLDIQKPTALGAFFKS